MAFQFFSDAGLTTPFTGSLPVRQQVGVFTPVDNVVFLGSSDATKKLVSLINPGVDQIAIAIADSAVGSGVESADFILALSAPELDTNSPNTALNLGVEILGGSALAIHIRYINRLNTITQDPNIRLETSDINEMAI
jgi:hypothetical protein